MDGDLTAAGEAEVVTIVRYESGDVSVDYTVDPDVAVSLLEQGKYALLKEMFETPSDVDDR